MPTKPKPPAKIAPARKGKGKARIAWAVRHDDGSTDLFEHEGAAQFAVECDEDNDLAASMELVLVAPYDPKMIENMVDAFLRWPLPDSVCADLCATERGYKHGRTGTSLLTHPEAKAMLLAVMESAGLTPAPKATK